MILKKKVPLIDQHDKHGFWGGKFGGSYIHETLKKHGACFGELAGWERANWYANKPEDAIYEYSFKTGFKFNL